jgi:hypothetical protein
MLACCYAGRLRNLFGDQVIISWAEDALEIDLVTTCELHEGKREHRIPGKKREFRKLREQGILVGGVLCLALRN